MAINSINRLNPDTLKEEVREHTLQCAKNFKTSWVDLGRALYSVWKDKLFKGWGYSTFDAYTSKEINIRKLTALKLLRSYYFLEKEEPQYIKNDYVQSTDAASVPSYEAVDVLRRLKSKKDMDASDYDKFKKNVLVKGKDVREVKKDLTTLIRQREELAPIETSKFISQTVLKDVSSLIGKLEAEV